MGDFGKRLKKLRQNHNLRQVDLADILGLAQTTITNYENNDRFPGQKTLKEIADYFNVSLDYLLGRTSNPTRIDHFLKQERPELQSAEDFLADEKVKRFFELLSNRSRRDIFQFLKDNYSDFDSPQTYEDIYSNLFTPILYSVGNLWETNKFTIEDERHYSSTINDLMAQLRLFFPKNGFANEYSDNKSPDSAKRMLALTAPGEHHNIGIQMITDTFTLKGWHTHYLPSELPVENIRNFILEGQIDLLAISATMSSNVNSLKNIISFLRNDRKTKNIKILVGGQPFNVYPDLWQEIGADFWARDVSETIKIINII